MPLRRVLVAGLLALVACAPVDGAPDEEIEGAVHRVASVDGRRWHWVEAGSGETTVVLLHGMPETWHGWHLVIPRLSGSARVLAPDLPGFGGTDAMVGSSSFRAVAGALRGWIDAAGVDRAVLVGHDWGALIGAIVAESAPARIGAYAHVSAPFGRYDLSRLPDYHDFVADPGSAERLLRIAELFVPRVYHAGLYGGEEVLGEALLQRRIDDFEGHAAGIAPYFRDLDVARDGTLGPDSGADLAELTMPVLVVVGDRDTLVPLETFLDVADRVPGFVGLRVIDDAGHYPAQEQPEALAGALRELIAR